MSEPLDSTPSFPVVIVGGSIVGLSAAVFLGARGVPCLVVERHSGSALHPRARGLTQRSMEMFATAGVSGIPEIPAGAQLRRVKAQTMVGAPTEDIAYTPKGSVPHQDKPPEHYSPHTGGGLSQDQLEPILRAKAIDLGATLWLGAELEGFEDRGPKGVVVWIKDQGNIERVVGAQYLLACDGNRSSIRSTLGIERQGVGQIQVMRSVLFRAPELEQYRRGGIGQWEIEQSDFEAFLAGYGDGRWLLMMRDDVERDEAALSKLIQRAVGLPMDSQIITTGRWELTGLVADTFSKGRVFLAGDAAHTLPPTRGGYGANTGIADAFNLAWKFAVVVSGQSEASLLDSYDQERRPVAWMRFLQAFARPDYARYATDAIRETRLLDPVAIELGELYRSDIIDGVSADLPPARCPDEWQGQPGTRAPHRMVTIGGASVSTLDFYGHGWVLVSSARSWTGAALEMVERTGIPVSAVDLTGILSVEDAALVEGDLGLRDGGASLVRPDGVIAWRSLAQEGSAEDLQAALTKAARPVTIVDECAASV